MTDRRSDPKYTSTLAATDPNYPTLITEMTTALGLAVFFDMLDYYLPLDVVPVPDDRIDPFSPVFEPIQTPATYTAADFTAKLYNSLIQLHEDKGALTLLVAPPTEIPAADIDVLAGYLGARWNEALSHLRRTLPERFDSRAAGDPADVSRWRQDTDPLPATMQDWGTPSDETEVFAAPPQR